MKFTGKGLIAPVFTPFKNNGELNLELIPKYFSYLNETSALDGILVNGTTGEGMSMNVEERKLCAEAWMKTVDKKMHIMVQIGGAPLPDVIELAKHAEKIGVDSILCLPDLYMKPKSFAELRNYLKLVSDAAPKTPLLFYHIPMFTGLYFNMGQFLEEMNDQVPTFVGIKYTSDDLDVGSCALKTCSSKYTIFLGADKVLLQSSVLGFHSAIATTFNIFRTTGRFLFNVDNETMARKGKQEVLNNIIDVITSVGEGDWVPCMKAAMNVLSPIDCGPVRPPMTMPDLNHMSMELSTKRSEMTLL